MPEEDVHLTPVGICQTPGTGRKAPRNVVDGILLVDKPQDWTSFDVLNCMKHQFRVAKIGHCGTLDPMATGLLVVLLGKATRWQDRLMGKSKVYEGALLLGQETDTEDSTGNVTAERNPGFVTEEMLRAAARKLTGSIEQIPPMVSAIKVHGTPLYKLARRGISLERKSRPVTIYSFDFTSVELPRASYRVHCSKGTYIRTLCADLGRLLGCGACMTALRRTRCGSLSLSDAHSLEEIRGMSLEELRGAVRMPENIPGILDDEEQEAAECRLL